MQERTPAAGTQDWWSNPSPSTWEVWTDFFGKYDQRRPWDDWDADLHDIAKISG